MKYISSRALLRYRNSSNSRIVVDHVFITSFDILSLQGLCNRASSPGNWPNVSYMLSSNWSVKD